MYNGRTSGVVRVSYTVVDLSSIMSLTNLLKHFNEMSNNVGMTIVEKE